MHGGEKRERSSSGAKRSELGISQPESPWRSGGGSQEPSLSVSRGGINQVRNTSERQQGPTCQLAYMPTMWNNLREAQSCKDDSVVALNERAM